MAIKLGLDAKLYHGTAGATADNEITNVRDLTLTLEKGEADATTRGAAGWRQTVATLKDATLEWEMVWDTADTAFTAIQDAFLNNTAIALKAIDSEGGQGITGDWDITRFTKTEALEDVQKVSVSAKPTYSTTSPVSWTS